MEKVELNFCKFFETESPVGNTNDAVFCDAGIDLYMPKQTKAFVEKLLEMNNARLSGDIFISKTGYYSAYTLISSTNKILANYDSHNGLQIILEVVIPLGIGIQIPESHHLDLRSKSSNFKFGFTEVHGLIDCAYTYGMAVQVIPLKNFCILRADQKFAQIVLIKNEIIGKLTEISIEDWDKSEAIIDRREKRKGGFGSTGKFKQV